MNQPYKVIREMRYTEVVYFDSEGEEVYCDSQHHNATTYYQSAPIPLTTQEIEYYL